MSSLELTSMEIIESDIIDSTIEVGRYVIDFKRPVGRVYHRDGTITENVTRINIKRKPDGTLRYAYPVPETYTLRREI